MRRTRQESALLAKQSRRRFDACMLASFVLFLTFAALAFLTATGTLGTSHGLKDRSAAAAPEASHNSNVFDGTTALEALSSYYNDSLAILNVSTEASEPSSSQVMATQPSSQVRTPDKHTDEEATLAAQTITPASTGATSNQGNLFDPAEQAEAQPTGLEDASELQSAIQALANDPTSRPSVGPSHSLTATAMGQSLPENDSTASIQSPTSHPSARPLHSPMPSAKVSGGNAPSSSNSTASIQDPATTASIAELQSTIQVLANEPTSRLSVGPSPSPTATAMGQSPAEDAPSGADSTASIQSPTSPLSVGRLHSPIPSAKASGENAPSSSNSTALIQGPVTTASIVEPHQATASPSPAPSCRPVEVRIDLGPGVPLVGTGYGLTRADFAEEPRGDEILGPADVFFLGRDQISLRGDPSNPLDAGFNFTRALCLEGGRYELSMHEDFGLRPCCSGDGGWGYSVASNGTVLAEEGRESEREGPVLFDVSG